MNLYLTSAYQSHSCLDRLMTLARLDTNDKHAVVSSPDEADAIVFVENTQFDDLQFEQLMRHRLVHEHPEKVFMYNEMDRAWPVLPGVYCSLTKSLTSPQKHVAFPYLMVCNSAIQEIHEQDVNPRWLYSFVGSLSHPVRKPLPSLANRHGCIVDTSEFCTWNPAQTSKYAYQKLYTDTMSDSRFILCPRGIGPASLRLFESMEAARVPVIISDDWVEPPQINWDFAVRIPESDIDQIPHVLSTIDNEWSERAAEARDAWEKHYAPEQLFNTLGDAIDSIQFSADLPTRSLKVAVHKWRVVAEHQFRNLTRPAASAGGPAPMSRISSLFSRKA